MPKRGLTAAAVERIKPPSSGQVDYFDSGYPGFALRISHGGARSWTLHYRLNGKQKRLTLGTWPALSLAEAREAWREARKAINAGIDPAISKAAPERPNSFLAVAEEWIRRDQAGNRTARAVWRILEKDVLPKWADREIASINRRDVLELLDGIVDRGAVTLSRRVHSYLHRLFRWSVGRGIVESNPLADLPKQGKENPRDRVLTNDELVLIWNAAAMIGWPFGHAVQLLMLTGARREEITRLRWSEIDLQRGEIRLEGDRTKNGKPHTIPLSPAAAAILGGAPRIAGSAFVFTTTGNTPVSGWSRAKQILDRALPSGQSEHLGDAGVPPWRIHDLRRTVATGMQRLGVGLQVIEAVLGHVSGSRSGIVQIYQRHSFDPEKRVALDKWAAHIDALVTGKSARIVTFPKEVS